MIDGGKCDEELLNSLWNNADWDKLESALFLMQRDIALAAKGKDREAVLMYQKRVKSLDTKMLAVRHIVTNCGTPGIDGVRWRTKSRFSKNLAYIHSQCEQHETEEPMENYEDLRCIINSLSNKCKKKLKRNKFKALTEYFYKKTEAIFTLKFDEISDIIESPLCKSAFKSSGY